MTRGAGSLEIRRAIGSNGRDIQPGSRPLMSNKIPPRPAEIHTVKSGLPTALLALAALTGPLPAADTSGALPKLVTQVAFPNLRFDRPVAMAYPDDGSNRLFVVEQHQAKIWSFINDRAIKTKQLFLQLPDSIQRGNEEGLLGLALHPNFKEKQAVLRLLLGQ